MENCLEGVDIGGRVMLQLNHNEQEEKVCIKLNWLKLSLNIMLLKHNDESLCFITGTEFLQHLKDSQVLKVNPTIR